MNHGLRHWKTKEKAKGFSAVEETRVFIFSPSHKTEMKMFDPLIYCELCDSAFRPINGETSLMQLMLDPWKRSFSFGFICLNQKGRLESPCRWSECFRQRNCFKPSAGLDERCPQSRDFLTFSLMFNHISCFSELQYMRFQSPRLLLPAGGEKKKILAGDGFLPPSHSRLCKRMVQHLGDYAASLSCQELDENIDTALKDNYSRQPVSIAQGVEVACS